VPASNRIPAQPRTRRPTLKLIEVPLPGIYPVQRHFDRVMAGGMAETVRLVGNRVVVGLVG